MRNIYTNMPTGQVPAASNPSRLRGIMTAKRILRGQILSICAVALLGTMPAVFAQSPDAESLGAQSRDAHTPDAETLDAQALAAQSGNVRSGEIAPLHLVAETLGTIPMPWMRGPSIVRAGPTTSTSMSSTFTRGTNPWDPSA